MYFPPRVGRRRRDADGDGLGREVCEPCHEVSINHGVRQGYGVR